MRPNVLERWGAASGLLAIALGIAAAAFERPWPDDPAALSALIADHHSAILAQSLLFVLSAGAFLWFLGSLRSFLLGAEPGPGRLTGVAFGAGLVWAGLTIVGQAPQIVLTLPSQQRMAPEPARAVEDLGFVTLGLANLPMAWLLPAPFVMIHRLGRPAASWQR